MVAAILLAISAAALGQFALYYWRSVVAGVAAQPLSERVRAAARLASPSVGAADFETVISLHDVTPGLQDASSALRVVRAYYNVVELIGRLAKLGFPVLAAWSQREMTTCSRYVAVLVDRRLERNLACAAEIHSC